MGIGEWIGILAFFISLISLIYTYRVTDIFGLRARIYDKKLQICLDLLEYIKAYSFGYHIHFDGHTIIGSFSVAKDMLELKEYESTMYAQVYFDTLEYWNKIYRPLQKFKNNPYLPQEVANSLNFLYPTITTAKKEELLEYGILKFDYTLTDENIASPSLEIVTCIDFIRDLQKVLSTIEKWVEETTRLPGLIRY